MSYPNTPQGQLVADWAKGILNKDLHTAEKYLHRDFTHVTLPKSLNRPPLNREEWLAQISKVFAMRGEGKTIIHSVTEAPGIVITYFTNDSTTNSGLSFVYEAISFAHIVTDSDGSLKIKKNEEFLDSKSYLDFLSKVAGGGH